MNSLDGIDLMETGIGALIDDLGSEVVLPTDKVLGCKRENRNVELLLSSLVKKGVLYVHSRLDTKIWENDVIVLCQ